MEENASDDKSARSWATGCHLAALSGFVVPFGNIFGPLIIWLMKRNDSPIIDDQGKESLNFQISMTIYMLVAALLILVIVGLFILPILALVDLILIILAAVKTSNGETYRYPLTIRLLS